MKTSEKEIVRSVLGRMADEAPDPVAFEELGAVLIRPDQPVRDTRSTSGVVGLVAAAFLLVAVAVFFSATTEEPASTQNGVLLLSTDIPDDLTLAHATMWNVQRTPVQDPGLAAATYLEYWLPGKQMALETDRTLTIDVEDRLSDVEARLERDTIRCGPSAEGEEINPDACRQLYEDSECFGLARIREGQLNPEACINELTEGMGGAGQFTETEVRDKPALIVELSETNSMSVMVFEGGGIISTVTGRHIDQEDILRVAAGLEPATPSEYAQHIATAEH